MSRRTTIKKNSGTKGLILIKQSLRASSSATDGTFNENLYFDIF